MNYKKILWMIPLILLLASPVMAADPVVPDYIHRYTGDDTATDLNNTFNLTSTGTYNTSSLIQGNASFHFQDGEEAVNEGAHGLTGGNNPLSITYWVNHESFADYAYLGGVGAFSTTGTMFWTATKSATQIDFLGIGNDHTFTVSSLNTGQWYHYAFVYHGNKSIELYVDGIAIESFALTNNQNVNSNRLRIGQSHSTANGFEGNIDDWRLYDRALSAAEVLTIYQNPNGSVAPPSPEADLAIPQTNSIVQSGITIISSALYTTVMSGNVELLNASHLYASAVIPIINPSKANDAYCQITVDGSNYDSEVSRTNVAGTKGVLNSMTNDTILAVGNYTYELECRVANGGTYQINNSEIVIMQMTTSEGVELVHNYTNITSLGAGTATFEFTTSANETEAGHNRSLYVDWQGTLDFSSTGNITTTIEIAGNNCSSIQRYGASGSTGSIGSNCYYPVTNDTTYDIVVHVTGAGDLVDAKMYMFEIISHEDEIGQESLTGTLINDTVFTLLKSINVTIDPSHSTNKLYVQAGISVEADNDASTDASFYFTSNGDNSSTYSRTTSPGQPGVIDMYTIFGNVSGTETVSLWGACASNNCTIIGGDMVAFITDTTPLEENSFVINATDLYTNATINEFNVKLDDNTTLSTTTSSITVFTTATLINLTFPANNDTTIKYFENVTTNHDTTTNHTIILRPWTRINALTPALVTINNFSMNYTDGATTTVVNTTNGAAYIPLFNGTYNFTIYDAVGDDGTEYAIQDSSITSAEYQENQSLIMLVTNNFNFRFSDEETGILIDDRNISIELISDVFANNYTTDTGLFFVGLLSPSEYTIRYSADEYLERFFIFTLVNGTSNDLNLTLIKSSDADNVTITVFDELGKQLEDAVIKVQRYDIGTNSFITNQILTTNFEGEAVATLVINEEYYKFVIEYEGQEVFVSTPTYIYGNTLTFTVIIGNTGFEDIFTALNVDGTINDLGSGVFSFVWNDHNNLATQACITATRLSRSGREQVNQTCAATTSGTVYLTVDNSTDNTYELVGAVTVGTTQLTIDTLIKEYKANVLTTNKAFGAFLAIVIVLTVAMIGLFSIKTAIVMTGFSVLLLSLTGIIPIGLTIAIPVFVLSLFITIVMAVKEP